MVRRAHHERSISFGTQTLGAFCVAIAMATFGLPAARAKEPPLSTPCLHVAQGGPCRPWDTVFGHPSTVAAVQRQLDAAQPGFFYGETYLTGAQVKRCAALVRTPAEHGTKVSFADALTPQQRQILREHGVLGPNGAINRAIRELPSAQQDDTHRVAMIVATHLQSGQPIFFWDGDGDPDTMADLYFLSAAEHAALQTQVHRANARAPEAPVRRPMGTIAEQRQHTVIPRPAAREVRAVRQLIDAHVTTAPPAAGDDTSPYDSWPWFVGAVFLGGLGIALFLRYRQHPEAPHHTLPLPIPPGLLDPPPALTGEATALCLPPDPFIGRAIDNRHYSYRILRVIGRGGMATVYETKEQHTKNHMAIKILSKADSADDVRRFHHEAAMLQRLRHPNTIRIYDQGLTDTGFPYLVMELLDGESLRTALKKERVLAVERAVRIARQILQSLDEAHRAGIVHRDLKPDNVFLTPHAIHPIDHVTVFDFGIAKETGAELLTQTGRVVGTPAYMAPEQIDLTRKDTAVDGRTDLYALGWILYEMLAGDHPFATNGRGPLPALHANMHTPPPPLLIAQDNGMAMDYTPLIALVHRALEKDPNDRPQTAAEFLAALDALNLLFPL